MAAVLVVGMPWENAPCNVNPTLGAQPQALAAALPPTRVAQVPVVNRDVGANNESVLVPLLQPARASYTSVSTVGIDRIYPAGSAFDLDKDGALTAQDLAIKFARIARDLIANDNGGGPAASIAGQQLAHLIRSMTNAYIFPVLRTRHRYTEIGANIILCGQQIQLLQFPSPQYSRRGWVSTKSHMELYFESMIWRFNGGWPALKPLLFVNPDGQDTAVPLANYRALRPPAGIAFDADHCASPMVLSVTEGSPPHNTDRVIVGTSLPKAKGYEPLIRWANAARMQRYDAAVIQRIRTAINARDVSGVLNFQTSVADLNKQIAAAQAEIPFWAQYLPNRDIMGVADGLINDRNAALMQFENTARNHKNATQEFFYHPHEAMSFQVNNLQRRTFCWSCWILYRFITNEPSNAVRWSEAPNYEPSAAPANAWRPYGNCAESMLNNTCAGWGMHGMIVPPNNLGQVNPQGNWVPAAPVPAVPAPW